MCRYPDDPGIAGAQGCDDDADLYPRVKPWWSGGAEPVGSMIGTGVHMSSELVHFHATLFETCRQGPA
jgi:hypothetical protein